MKPVYEVEVISTGDEIVLGQLLDTNSSWIARQSTEQGARVRRLTCVGDDVEDIEKAIKIGLSEGRNLIVITGGLGPSHDDLTIEAIAQATGREVVYDESALKMLESKCRESSISLTDRRKKMARIVEGSEPLENPVGLAPGLKMRIGASLLIALPGIPKEMKPMFKRYVSPIISEATSKRSAAMKLRIYMPYYSTFPILNRVKSFYPEAYVKTHSKPPSKGEDPGLVDGVEVNVVVWEDRSRGCEERLCELKSRIIELVEDEGGRVVVERLEERG